MDKELFLEFQNTFPEYKSIDWRILKDKALAINQLLISYIIKKRNGIELPASLGQIFIGTCDKNKSENCDYNTSGKIGKHVENRNYETDGYLAKLFYTNYDSKYNFKYKFTWGFKGCREFKQKISHSYPPNWEFYIKVDPYRKISRMFREAKATFKKFIDV